MAENLAHLVATSLGFGAVIALLLLLRRVLDGRFAPTWWRQVWSWLLVVMFLYLPARSFPPQVIPSLIQVDTPQAVVDGAYDRYNARTRDDAAFDMSGGSGVVHEDREWLRHALTGRTADGRDLEIRDNDYLRSVTVDGVTTYTVHWTGVAYLIYAIGAALLFVGGLVRYSLFRRRCMRWSTPAGVKDLAALEKRKEALGLKREVECYHCSLIHTPLLMGFLHPVILLPEDIPQGSLDTTLAHELTHLKSRDTGQLLLTSLARAAHWFNPMVWLLVRQLRLEMELCCDYALLKDRDMAGRRAYGQAILEQMTAGDKGLSQLTTSFSGNKREVFARFRAMMDDSPKRRGRIAMAAALVVVALAGSLVGCQTGSSTPEGRTVTLAEGIEAPQAVTDYAREYVEEQLAFYEEKEGYEITKAEIVGLTAISTGSAAENSGVSMYLLEYRLKAAHPEEVVLAGGMTMEDGAITEWGSAGQPYLLLGWEDSGEETAWEPLQITHTLSIEENYGTPEMLEEYGNAYTAAAMELYRNWRFESSFLTSADLDRDGEDEIISVEQKNSQIWELVVTKVDGTELFREGAGTPHVGWNSLYLHTDSQGQASLLRYNPYSSTGLSTYGYTLFSLEGGMETVIQEGGVGFENHRASEKTAELIAFADEVNALLLRSALLLSTQEGDLIIGPEGRSDHLEHLSSVGDFLIEPDLEVYRSAFRPESSEGVNPLSAFFTSYYARPEELDFEEFLRYFPDDGTVPDDPEDLEFQALTAHPLWSYKQGAFISTPIHRYSRQSVDRVLAQYAGITTHDLSCVGMDNVIYLEEYDAWYNFTSDYGPGVFDPVYGLREGNTVTLWEQSSSDGTPGDILTLEEAGDGFRILSHLPRQ